MKLNSHVIFLIAIVGIIAAGVVGATILNNGAMKQTDFDGIKVSVPADSNFVKTADGYADSKYGITIHTFKNNDSMVNYLKGKSGVSVISLKNQPPQSVAFVQGDDTNVLVTNGGEAIAIGAKDQGLVSDMANTVVFSNHQKSAKPNPIIPIIFPQPYLDMGDFNYIVNLTKETNTIVINNTTVNQGLNEAINQHNDAVKNNTLQQNSPSNNNQQNTSLLNNKDVSNIVDSISSDDPYHRNSAGGDSGAVASSSANSGGGNAPASSVNSNPINSVFSSGSSASSSGNDAPASNNQPQKMSKTELRDAIEKSLPSGSSISQIEDNGKGYLVTIKDSHGKINKVEYSYTGQIMGNVK